MNSADLGITLQSLICKKYNILPHKDAIEQFRSNYNEEYEEKLKPLVEKIFNEIGDEPVECLTYSPSAKAKEHYSPHNFVLSCGKTLSVRTNKNGDKIAPRVVGQAGIKTFNQHFDFLYLKPIEEKEEIKKIVYYHIHQMLPVFVDYLFVSDYTIWIKTNSNGDYEEVLFDKSKYIDIDFELENFTFTKPLNEWNESITLKYKGNSLAEIQIHKNRSFKFRFIMKTLLLLIKEIKGTLETFGMTAEKTICDIFDLDYSEDLRARSSLLIQEEITPVIEEAFKELPVPLKHTGSQKGTRGNQSKCSYDFLLEGKKTLSVKTNTGKKICPPEVGQPSAATCYLYFGHFTEAEYIDDVIFKEIVLKNIDEMMPIYLEHLFDSDYLLWIRKVKNYYEQIILEKDFVDGFFWEEKQFSFTRNSVEEWNESNTLKYKGISIGEFQVHSNRNSYKFRFIMNNLIAVIENGGRKI